MSKSVEIAVREAISKGVSLKEFSEILCAWRDRGLSQEESLRVLAQLRAEVDEEAEDRVLEFMDVASGFCRPELNVWHKE